MKTLLTLLLLSSTLVVTDAHAQDDWEDLDGETSKKKKNKKKKAKKARKVRTIDAESEIIREIERGFYAKTSVGATAYLLDLSGIMRTGTAMTLAFGNDFVDTDGYSMAWEVGLYQGVHNGMHYEQQAGLLDSFQITANNLTQGDSRTIGAMANYEYSSYVTRRLGLGFRAGGGIIAVPLLMKRDSYLTKVVPEWNGAESSIHKNVHPIGFAGPTLEYYTKLSHFSVGIDVDVFYAVGMDLGFSGCGYMKYTF